MESFDKLGEIYDRSGPFGDAEASNVDFRKLRNSFINLNSFQNQTIEETLDTSTRVIVGRKGSGKTLYLRFIQDHYRRLNSENDNTVYITDIDNKPTDSELITKINSWFDKDDSKADETWRGIWKMVILRTAYTHLFYSKTLDKYITKKEKLEFSSKYSKILPKINSPTSIFNQLTNILTRFNSLQDLNFFMFADEWGHFEYDMNLLIKSAPPIYFFIDQLDDDFSHAPYDWLKCQYGLFSAMFRFIRGNTLGGRLHIIACIRELVYAYILSTQHGSKYLSEPKIKVIRWDYNLAKHFFDRKVESLDDSFFKNPRNGKTIQNFFGLSELKLSRGKGFNEEIHSYILRHTMLMPRDIINVGNIFNEKCNNSLGFIENENALKDAVKYVARQIAKEQTVIASILISTSWIYNGVVEDGALSVYTDEVMVNSINANLCKMIRYIGEDRFSGRKFSNINKSLSKFGFKESDRPFNALFIAGLLGYIELDSNKNERAVFFSESRNALFEIPKHRKSYVFHSSLIDYLNIKAKGKPVYA
ncbi:hypothetical protein J0A67_04650 [Algoriphagus aestuariicola]|uniref:Uncharacterized protein n=1 Tax=Algoriphagus aestuariicola TaxID=1852016 RepID=A0ABS3BM85_9BACT|nr:hypothetical protein [Algoriphagus aestuariicola]MBN7800137.1 hypothetical protein [Algoriphagus aestuariicola]